MLEEEGGVGGIKMRRRGEGWGEECCQFQNTVLKMIIVIDRCFFLL